VCAVRKGSYRPQSRRFDAPAATWPRRLDAKVEQIGSRTFNRLGALVVVVAGLLFIALHGWPPH
jgi:hypothetical protein